MPRRVDQLDKKRKRKSSVELIQDGAGPLPGDEKNTTTGKKKKNVDVERLGCVIVWLVGRVPSAEKNGEKKEKRRFAKLGSDRFQ